MNDLLQALGWRQTGRSALAFVLVLNAAMLALVACLLGLTRLAGVPAAAAQGLGWAIWLGWLGFAFVPNRADGRRPPCALPYRLAFAREVLPGIGCSFALMLRPIVEGALDHPRPLAVPGMLAIGALLATGGAALLIAGSRALGLAQTFFVYEYVADERPIMARGIYRHVRHPLFVGGTITSLGISLAIGSPRGIALSSIAVVVVPFYALFEDRRCRRVLGAPYLRYRAFVPAILPRVGWRARRPHPELGTAHDRR